MSEKQPQAGSGKPATTSASARRQPGLKALLTAPQPIANLPGAPGRLGSRLPTRSGACS